MSQVSSFTIRQATVDDAQTLAELHIAGWQGAYGGIVAQNYLDSLSLAQRTQNWADWLPNPDMTALLGFAPDGTPAGFCSFSKIKTMPPGQSIIRPVYTAEILALYLKPAFYRQGLGRQLMQEAAAMCLAKKHGGLVLWVLAKNQRGCAFYEAMGGQRIGSQMIDIGGQQHKEACYGWRDLRKLLAK